MNEYRYRVIEKHLQDLIRTSALAPGDRLPSLRTMARTMKASVSTVSQAYLELEKRGVIESRPKSGFFVRPEHRELPPLPRNPRPSPEPTPSTRGKLIETALTVVGDRNLVPLGVICPDQEVLPGKALNRAMVRVLRESGPVSLGYEPVPGNLRLRTGISLLSMEGGIRIRPEEMIITNGAMEALAIALRCTTLPGDNVLIQSPTYHCFLQLLENCGLKAIEIPSCPEQGINPADLPPVLDRYRIAACVLSPNFNNPDGGLTPDEAKREIVSMLASRDIPLIEDDVSGQLHFGPHRPDTFKKYDNKGLVLHCSSFSKTIAPGYRIGWIIPGRFHEKALEIKATSSVCSATPTQMAMAAYLEGPQYANHLKRLRGAIGSQMQAMQMEIGRSFPAGTSVTRPRGGAVLWVRLPRGIDSVRFFLKAKARGIGIVPGTIFSTQDRYADFIRLGCGGVWNETIRDGIRVLGSLVEEMR
jgi:DNA-binding transcriptional MocR family regulator